MADGHPQDQSLEVEETFKTFPGMGLLEGSSSQSKPPWSFNTLEEALRAIHPHGHPSFIKKVLWDISTHSGKNHDYAAGGDPLGNFRRVATLLSNYPNFPLATECGIAMVYMLKQLDAVLWNMSQGHTLKIESLEDRLRDITIYSLILRCMLDDGK